MSRKRAASQIDEWELEDIGIEHPQYFQGRGVADQDFFDAVFVGVGEDYNDALSDALESLAQSEDVDSATLDEIEKAEEISQSKADKNSVDAYNRKHREDYGMEDEDDEGSDAQYHVALYIKWSGDEEGDDE